MNGNRRIIVLAALSVAAVLLAANALCASGKTQSIRATERKMAKRLSGRWGEITLPEALKRLHEQSGLDFAVEGAPVIRSARIDVVGDTRSVLHAIAQAFDYQWTISRGGLVLLTKRFETSAERPQMLRAELQRTLSDMLVILPKVPADRNHMVWPPIAKQLAATLDHWQLDRLKRGARLTYGDLSPSQRILLTQAIQIRAFGVPRGVLEANLAALRACDRAVIRRGYNDPSTRRSYPANAIVLTGTSGPLRAPEAFVIGYE